MRLPLFDVMDDTIALLSQRQEYYQTCANELQALIRETLFSSALLGVHTRVKGEHSLREKILRKHLYLQYDNQYDLLNNLSDLIGLRAECRFMGEEKILYDLLCDACTQQHSDGTRSIPAYPTIRFDLATKQPQHQQNGLAIYRIDGKYHKNGVSAPFELQIKSLVHVFWAEVEHQLIYKNNAYSISDSFLKKLLYTNYEILRQMNNNLQLLHDQMQQRSGIPQSQQHAMSTVQPVLAKAISELFLQSMRGQMGYSMRLGNASDILARYLLHNNVHSNSTVTDLIDRIRSAAACELVFDEALELDGAFFSDDPFHNTVGCHLSQQLNLNYDWNVFFRMLFTLGDGNNLLSFAEFIRMYCDRFQRIELYAIYEEQNRHAARERILLQLGDVLTEIGDISILFSDTIERLENTIQQLCARGCEADDTIRLHLQYAINPLNGTSIPK